MRSPFSTRHVNPGCSRFIQASCSRIPSGWLLYGALQRFTLELRTLLSFSLDFLASSVGLVCDPRVNRCRMTKMPPAGYPAFLQYLQSGRVSEIPLPQAVQAPLPKRGHVPLDGGPTDSDSLGRLLTREPGVQQPKHEHLFADTEVGMTAPFLVDDALLFLGQPHAK